MSRRAKTRLVVGLLCSPLVGVFVAGAVAQPSHQSRTIPLHGTFKVAWSGSTTGTVKCPPGTPKTTAEGSITPCYLNVGHAKIAGLGAVTERYTQIVLGSDTKCLKLKFTAVLTVAGKGTITAPAATKSCLVMLAGSGSVGMDESTAQFRITGGTGSYAGASGHGTIHQVNHGGTGGPVTDTWAGTLTLKG